MKNILYIAAFVFAVFSCNGGQNSKEEAGKNFQVELQRLSSNPSEIWICAHRGNTYAGIQNGIPENSVEAIRQAIVSGADIVEIDVRTTADGHFVLMHDVTMDRTTNASGKVSDKTLAELKTSKLKAANGILTEYAIPTLEEALSAGRGKIFFNLDKIDETVNLHKLVHLIDSMHMMNSVFFYIGGSKETGDGLKNSYAQSIYFPMVSTVSDLNYWLSDPQIHLVHVKHLETSATSLANAAREKQIVMFSNALNDDGDNTALQGDFSGIDKMKEVRVQIIQTDYVEIIRNYLK